MSPAESATSAAQSSPVASSISSTFENTLLALYGRIDRSTRNIFLAALGLNILAYFIFYAHHPIHNHLLRMPWIPWNEQIYLGRWFNHVVLRIIHAADMPVFVPLLSSMLAVAMSLLTLSVWRLRLSAIERFLIVGLISVAPFFLAFYYYTWLTLLFMFGPFFAAASLAVCRRLRVMDVAAGAVLFLFMMASYQTAISVYAVIAASAIVVDLTRPHERSLIDIAKTAAARILAGAIGGAGYLISLPLLKIKESHATKPLELSDVPERFVKVIEVAFEHLTLTQPEFHTPLKLLLLVMLIAGVLLSLWTVRRHPLRLAILVPLWFGVIVATKTMYLVSADSSFFEYRYNTSIAFLYAFGAAIALHATTLRLPRSLILILAIFIVVRFVQVDLVRQEVLLRGQAHDYAFANRILVRLESLPDLDLSKTYDFVRIGKYSSFRQRLLRAEGRSYDYSGDGHMDNGEISDRWVDEQMLLLLGTRIKLKNVSSDPNFQKKIASFREKYSGKRKRWPHPESVFIDGDTIYVYID